MLFLQRVWQNIFKFYMKKILYSFIVFFTTSLLIGCFAYSFTGGNTGNAKTIQVSSFRNVAPLIEPSLGQFFTQELQDLFLRQTNLSLVTTDGDLAFEGEITGYRISPMSATAQQTAAQNRLTITIKVRYTNKLVEKDNFEKAFSFFYDFPANGVLTGSLRDTAFKEITDRITQDIFNASVAKW